MIVVILAGGFGSRLSEETHSIPKPMVEIGKLPILMHLMKYYSKFGHNEFIILTGYKSQIIKNYFKNTDNVRILLKNDNKVVREDFDYEWDVNLLDTGLESSTAKRIFATMDLIKSSFFMTYGDGLSDIDLDKLLSFHLSKNKIATVTAVRPPARFGSLEIINDEVTEFREKSTTNVGYINGGFFVLNKEVFSYFDDLEDSFENNVLPKLARENNFSAFKHDGFWQPMDTLREKEILNNLVINQVAPWMSKNEY
jgi:glucose-1-phosphate cytidylyltransferase